MTLATTVTNQAKTVKNSGSSFGPAELRNAEARHAEDGSAAGVS